MRNILCACFLLLYLFSNGQVKELTVGDKVPDLVFNNLINFHKEKARLSDFKGKIVILDFWEIGCSACVDALPSIQKLRDEYKDKIEVINVTSYGTAKDVMGYLKRLPYTKDVVMPTVIKDKTLRELFPFKIISHVVWIGPDARVKAITGTEHVKKDFIEEMLHSASVNWPVKKDVIIDRNSLRERMLDFNNKSLSVPPSSFHYSSFMGAIAGLAHVSQEIDTATQTFIINQINMPLSHFIEGAITGSMTGSDEYKASLILHVKDKEKYIGSQSTVVPSWSTVDTQNAYSYLAAIPYTSQEDVEAFIRDDLKRWLKQSLGINIQVEKNGKDGGEVYIITETMP